MKNKNPDETLDSRRTGGAGSLTQPTTDREYRERMDKLAELSGK